LCSELIYIFQTKSATDKDFRRAVVSGLVAEKLLGLILHCVLKSIKQPCLRKLDWKVLPISQKQAPEDAVHYVALRRIKYEHSGPVQHAKYRCACQTQKENMFSTIPSEGKIIK